MLARAKSLLINPWGLLGIMVALLWIAADYSERFIENKSLNKQPVASFTAIKVPQLHLHEQQKQEISALFKQYSEELISNEQLDDVMSKEEQLAQQGELQTVFIDDKALTLKAVIKNESLANQPSANLIALLLVMDKTSKTEEIQSFENNSSVFGYQLSIHKNTEVKLTKLHDSGIQTITLTMYETNTSQK